MSTHFYLESHLIMLLKNIKIKVTKNPIHTPALFAITSNQDGCLPGTKT
jgi:hypothetical protein